MNLVAEFLARYAREFDFFQEAARLAFERCDAALRQNGIRSMVTYRAKRSDRLGEKLKQRMKDGASYGSIDEVYKDVVDLAGVRIALYFPGEMDKVEALIKEIFTVEKTKVFPQPNNNPIYKKRFSGYAARHFRVYIPAMSLAESDRRYNAAQIEIQVASVLIHAWAEVEHDLAYKPLAGKLSDEEHAILDELNGLVLAGEIALERLQNAGDLRYKRDSARFNNHYELAKYIYDRISGL